MPKVTPKHVRYVWPEFRKDVERLMSMSMAIVNQRQGEIYDDNWGVMSLESLIDAAKYKCDRARFTANPTKRLDDVMDAINYLYFVGVRVMADMDSLREANETTNTQKKA